MTARQEPPRRRDLERELVDVAVGDDDADSRKRRRDGGDEQDRDSQQVVELHQRPRNRSAISSGSVDDDVGLARISSGPSSEATPTQTAVLSAPSTTSSRSAREGVQVGAVVAARRGPRAPRRPPPGGAPRSLVDGDPGPQLEDHAARVRDAAPRLRRAAAILAARVARASTVRGAAPVDRLDRPLVLQPNARAGERLASQARDVNAAAGSALRDARVQRGLLVAGPSSSSPWLPA